MKGSRLLVCALLAACQKKTAPPEKAPVAVVEASAPVAMVEASAPMDAGEPPWLPPTSACRHAIAHRATFDQLHDSVLVDAILDGSPAAKSARDCRGDRVTFEHPLTETQRRKPSTTLASPPTDDDAGATGLVRVDRYDLLDGRLAVFTTVAVDYGYAFACRGFEALVRLDPDEIVVEGVGPAELYECDAKKTPVRLATLGGRVAMLLPVSRGTGESGDFGSAWLVSVADRGALRTVGEVRRARGAGNGSMMTGKWFGNMSAELVDAGSFAVEETWRFVRYEVDGKETSGATRKVLRTYALGDAGLVGSPTGDPTH